MSGYIVNPFVLKWQIFNYTDVLECIVEIIPGFFFQGVLGTRLESVKLKIRSLKSGKIMEGNQKSDNCEEAAIF